MKVFDLAHDSIELRARPTGVLQKILPDGDPRLEGIPEGYVEAVARVGGEMVTLWFPPEQATKLSIGLAEKADQCKARVYDP